MAETFAVGIIGFGLAGSLFHAPFVAATPGLRLAAVSTSDEHRAQAAVESYPGVVVHRTPDELLADDALDVVVVAAPNRAHVALANAALTAGRHVVVDKPLAGSAAAAQQLVDLAAEKGRILTVYQNRRWDGDFLTLRALVESGRLGTVWRFESRIERWRPEVAERWRESPDVEDVGGVLFDLGSHLVDQAVVLFGPVTSVYAEVLTRRSGARVDDDAFLALSHADGVRSHIWCSLAAALGGPRFRVLGSEAGFVKDGVDPQEDALRAGARPRPGERWGADPQDQWGVLGTASSGERVPTQDGDYGAFYRGLVTALRGEGEPPVDPRDAVATLAVLEAARRSWA